ncbi:carbohydrate kinase family protein [Priestia megaterium]
MGKLFSIGEVLIDMIPAQKGLQLKEVESFTRVPGGAPANVAAVVATYGNESALITKVGEDAFGDFLVDTLREVGVGTDMVYRTEEANTALAFVSLREDGERDFSFYRNPSADLLLTEDEINPAWFASNDVLHFCSVDLVESPMKYAHMKAIKSMKEKGGVISFDPNVRLPLWKDHELCRQTILEFIPQAHIVKISDDELSFITGIEDEQQAIQSLFTGDVQVVVFTKGAEGATLYTKQAVYESNGYKVAVVDTTGAGDAFIGGFLYQLLSRDVSQENLTAILDRDHDAILRFANASGALTTTGKGAISSIPAKEVVEQFCKPVAN